MIRSVTQSCPSHVPNRSWSHYCFGLPNQQADLTSLLPAGLSQIRSQGSRRGVSVLLQGCPSILWEVHQWMVFTTFTYKAVEVLVHIKRNTAKWMYQCLWTIQLKMVKIVCFMLCNFYHNKNKIRASLVVQWLRILLSNCNAGDTDLIPGPGRSHVPWSN